MTRFAWSDLKNEQLLQERGVVFEQIVRGELIATTLHPTRPGQHILIFVRDKYCWAVPCVMTAEVIFLKTAYPSRKFTRKYLNKEESQ